MQFTEEQLKQFVPIRNGFEASIEQTLSFMISEKFNIPVEQFVEFLQTVQKMGNVDNIELELNVNLKINDKIVNQQKLIEDISLDL